MNEYQDEIAWAMFFTAVKSWQYHPGTELQLTTAECAAIADEMLIELRQRRNQWAT